MTKVKEENFIQNVKGKEINLKEYYEVIMKRLWVIIAITVLTTVAGFLYGHHNNDSSSYQASTRMIIDTDDQKMKTLLVIIKDPIIIEKVTKELNLSQSAEETASQLQVSSVDGSQVVSISVTNANPATAVNIANMTAELFKKEAADILNFKSIKLLSPAKSTLLVNGNQNNMIAIGLVLGFVLGIGLTFLLDSLDGSIKRKREAEEILGVPVIGNISNMNKKKLLVKKKKETELELRSEAVGTK